MGDKYAANGDAKGLWRCAFLYPELAIISSSFVPVFVLTLFGTDAIISLLYMLPDWVISAFSSCRRIIASDGVCNHFIDNWKTKINAIFLYWIFCSTVHRHQIQWLPLFLEHVFLIIGCI